MRKPWNLPLKPTSQIISVHMQGAGQHPSLSRAMIKLNYAGGIYL